DDLARYRRSVQAVFQDPYSSLNPRMRVEHIVAEPLPPGNGASRAATRERVADVLQPVGLTRQSAALHPHDVSGGQRPRIPLTGEVPNPLRPPAGCAFIPAVRESCRSAEPKSRNGRRSSRVGSPPVTCTETNARSPGFDFGIHNSGLTASMVNVWCRAPGLFNTNRNSFETPMP